MKSVIIRKKELTRSEGKRMAGFARPVTAIQIKLQTVYDKKSRKIKNVIATFFIIC